DHVGEQQPRVRVEPEFDLEVDERARLQLPCLFQHEKGVAGDALHLGKESPLLVVSEDVGLRKREERLLSLDRLCRIEKPKLRTLSGIDEQRIIANERLSFPVL